jgi:hypothetical protein
VLEGATFAQQSRVLQQGQPATHCFIQRGCRFYQLQSGSPHLEYRPEQLAVVLANFRRLGVAYRLAKQSGWLRHGTRRRELCEWFIPHPLVNKQELASFPILAFPRSSVVFSRSHAPRGNAVEARCAASRGLSGRLSVTLYFQSSNGAGEIMTVLRMGNDGCVALGSSPPRGPYAFPRDAWEREKTRGNEKKRCNVTYQLSLI